MDKKRREKIYNKVCERCEKKYETIYKKSKICPFCRKGWGRNEI